MDVNYQKIERAAAARRKVVRGVTYTLLGVWALAVLFPFYWICTIGIHGTNDSQRKLYYWYAVSK